MSRAKPGLLIAFLITSMVGVSVKWVSAGPITVLPQTPLSVVFQIFVSGPNFHTPVGIDFDEPTAELIASVNYPTGTPGNLELIDVSTAASGSFSSLAGLSDELKIATQRNSPCAQFPVGEVFTGNGKPGQIVRISADGNTVTNPWVTLPGEPFLLRGSLYVDRSCVFNGDLIVVTGNGSDPDGGNVWRVTGGGAAT